MWANTWQEGAQRSRSTQIEIAVAEWSELLSHVDKAATNATWNLPPEALVERALVQMSATARGVVLARCKECREPSAKAEAREKLVRALKRLAESFIACLSTMRRSSDSGGVPFQALRDGSE